MTMEVVNEIRDVLNVGTNNKEMEADEELEQSGTSNLRGNSLADWIIS